METLLAIVMASIGAVLWVPIVLWIADRIADY